MRLQGMRYGAHKQEQCSHIQGLEPRAGMITVEVYDDDGNRLELAHVSIWDDRKPTTIPRLTITLRTAG
jgi:hypothetical protein